MKAHRLKETTNMGLQRKKYRAITIVTNNDVKSVKVVVYLFGTSKNQATARAVRLASGEWPRFKLDLASPWNLVEFNWPGTQERVENHTDVWVS